MSGDFLQGASSCCELDAVRVVAQENRAKYLGINGQRQTVRLFHVDGDIIPQQDKDTVRCDYLLLNDDLKEAYFIELKAAKVKHALEQVNHTVEMARGALPGYEVYKRIVFNGAIGVAKADMLRQRIREGRSKAGREHFLYKRALMQENIN
jgi:hypothetical protein